MKQIGFLKTMILFLIETLGIANILTQTKSTVLKIENYSTLSQFGSIYKTLNNKYGLINLDSS